MRYYLIAGEASGDLHASRLMLALKRHDPQAVFRFIGGDQMAAVGGTPVRHYRELAYMGLFPVLRHLPTILRNMQRAKHDISQWQPDCVILVDYPGFNLSIAKYVHRLHLAHPDKYLVYYYIAPKIWAWKEYRIKNIKRDVDRLFSILPFEVDFFEHKHHYPIHYVGNPTYDEVKEYMAHNANTTPGSKGRLRRETEQEAFDGLPANASSSPTDKPIIAVLCGSRKQEIKDNLPPMLAVADRHAAEYQIVVGGAPGIAHEYYEPFTRGHQVTVLPSGQTYDLLSHAHTALVTSGTATLETALFGVPQVVCYATALPRLFGFLRKVLVKVKYVSLVNLIAGREVVPELVADGFNEQNLERHLSAILQGPAREAMLQGYAEVEQRLKPVPSPSEEGNTAESSAPENAARIMTAIKGQ